MALFDDGTGVYTIKADGTRDYGCTTSMEINGQKMYAFDPKTGVLQVSMPPGDLEILMKQIGDLPSTGRDLALPTPFFADGPARFKGVKRIEPIPGLKENEYLMRLVVPDPRPPTLE